MAVIKLTKANFETEALKSTKPVLIDFYADWCGPCKMVSPLVDELAEESEAY
jgi:thioredoxin 1